MLLSEVLGEVEVSLACLDKSWSGDCGRDEETTQTFRGQGADRPSISLLLRQQTAQPAHPPPLSSCSSLGSGFEIVGQPCRPITHFQEPESEVLHDWVTLPSPAHSSCTGASDKELSPMKLTSPIPPRVGSGLASSLKVMEKAQECERRERMLQYTCLENPMNRGAWQTTVHGVAKSQT